MKKKRKTVPKPPAAAPRLFEFKPNTVPKPNATVRLLEFGILAVILFGSAIVMAGSLPNAHVSKASNLEMPGDLRHQYASVIQQVKVFEEHERKLGVHLIGDNDLRMRESQIGLDANGGQYDQARRDVAALKTSITNLTFEMNGGSYYGPEDSTVLAGSTYLPIVFYHYTPPDFEAQVSHLESAGYTVIDLDRAIAGIEGATLPPKPVVLTFDDGFANQMEAFAILQKHHMKATFYIINGGAKSDWCIGASRRYNDPLQPPQGCGDAYLSWDQIRTLDKSGLITIGGHTLDHENLATLPESEQRNEIITSKIEIEKELGHTIRHFAYPYGAFTTTTVDIVREAGYISAASTLDGDYQAPSTEYTLRRVRDAWQLN